MKVLVCGAGEVGFSIARQLAMEQVVCESFFRKVKKSARKHEPNARYNTVDDRKTLL